MKWRRVIEYDGDQDWVRRTVARSIHGTLNTSGSWYGAPCNTITEVSSHEVTDDATDTEEAVPHVRHDLGGEAG